jgi:energy-coupling factor transporter ATP-binding protein EcfA2
MDNKTDNIDSQSLSIAFISDYIIECTYDHSPIRRNTFIKRTRDKLEGRELDNAINSKTKSLGLQSGHQAKLTKSEMYHYVDHEYKRLFKKGDTFNIRNNMVNILVGDNGCGKSTLIKEFIDNNINYITKNNIKCYMVNMEESNPKISSPKPEHGFTYNISEINNMFMWQSESHGETREGVLRGILQLDFDILILDEPESGLSLRNQLKYLNELKSICDNKTIIVVTHSKVLVENVDCVFDVETMKWVDSEVYLNNILE